MNAPLVGSVAAALLLFAAGACATEDGMPYEFPSDGDRFDVEIHDDGFVVGKEGRVPVEGFVLRMRQHMRALSAEQRAKVVVYIRFAAGSGAKADETRDWLVDQLYLMGVGWAKFS
jgi:hypothetical protein